MWSGRGGFLPQSATNWIFSLSLGAGCALLSGAAYAQNSDSQPPQQQQSHSAVIRQMIQAEAARRNAARQGAAVTPGTPEAPAPAAPPLTAPAPATPEPTTPVQTAPTQAAPVSTPAVPTQASFAVPVVPATTSTTTTPQPPASVKSVKIGRDKTGSVIEIVNSRAIAPALQTLSHPPRLVIDLPNANVTAKDRFIVGKGDQFTEVHVDQYQESPPVTRVTVDLVEAKPYTWDAAGNRLTIRLKPAVDPAAAKAVPPPAQPTTIPTFSAASKPAVVPVSSTNAGSAVIVGSRIGSGSSVTASTETAVLHIARGGELHVCPNSTVSVTASKNGQELMFGMSTGTLETHYHLEIGSDAVLTPDFRMLLAGPGDFDYAISSNSHGDTCVRALLGNTASLLVSELMGDRTYQVKPTEQVVFQQGRIDRISNDLPFDCGCAAPPPPVMRASVPEPTQVAEAKLPPNLQMPSSSSGTTPRAVIDPMLPPLPTASRPAVAGRPGSQTQRASAAPETAPPVPSKKQDLHVQIEAPLVFRGSDRARTTQTATNMPPKAPAQSAPVPPTPAPAPQAKQTTQEPKAESEHRGFFGRVKGFFSAIFH
jgi:hypothetical protein